MGVIIFQLVIVGSLLYAAGRSRETLAAFTWAWTVLTFLLVFMPWLMVLQLAIIWGFSLLLDRSREWAESRSGSSVTSSAPVAIADRSMMPRQEPCDAAIRRVSARLTIAIIIAPIFALATLRRGYGASARAWSLGWMIVSLIACIGLASADNANRTIRPSSSEISASQRPESSEETPMPQPDEDYTYATPLDAASSTAFANPDDDRARMQDQNIPDRPLQSAPPIDTENISMAAAEFDRLYTTKGLIGLRSYSLACHDAATRDPSWRNIDFCAAFDLLTHRMDEAASEKNGFPIDAYFQSAADHATDAYPAVHDTARRTDRLEKMALDALATHLGPATP